MWQFPLGSPFKGLLAPRERLERLGSPVLPVPLVPPGKRVPRVLLAPLVALLGLRVLPVLRVLTERLGLPVLRVLTEPLGLRVLRGLWVLPVPRGLPVLRVRRGLPVPKGLRVLLVKVAVELPLKPFPCLLTLPLATSGFLATPLRR